MKEKDNDATKFEASCLLIARHEAKTLSIEDDCLFMLLLSYFHAIAQQ